MAYINSSIPPIGRVHYHCNMPQRTQILSSLCKNVLTLMVFNLFLSSVWMPQQHRNTWQPILSKTHCKSVSKCRQGCNRHIYLRGQSHFSWFFSRLKIPILVDPKPIFVVFKSEKQKKKVLTTFYNLSYFHFQFSTFPFTIFLPFYSIFTPFCPCLFFPDTSAKISRSEISGGHSAPLPVMPLSADSVIMDTQLNFTKENYHLG